MPHCLLIYRIKKWIVKNRPKMSENAKNVLINGLNHCTSTSPWNFIKKSIQTSSTTFTWYIFYLEWRSAYKRSKLMASFQKGRQRLQKRKDLCLSWIGAVPPMLQRWQIWKPIESEYLMIYFTFFENFITAVC